MLKRIRLQPDYDTEPLWDIDAADFVYPSELNLSSGALARLERWQAQYDSLLNLADPSSMGFKTAQEAEAFQKDGLELAQQMQEELGSEYQIWYRNQQVQIPVAV